MNHTKDKINLYGIESDKLKSLINKLSVETNGEETPPHNSIMSYGILCQCDDAFLCEHRLQWIVDWAIANVEL